jgi:hypothetical protein
MSKEKQEVKRIVIDRAENGWSINVERGQKETLGQRAGWCPSSPSTTEPHVAKSDEGLLSRIADILKKKSE